MAVRVTIALSDITELPEPQVEAWLDANANGDFDPGEKFTLVRSGAVWSGMKPNATGGFLLVRVVAPLGTNVKIEAKNTQTLTISRLLETRPDWFLGAVV